jgi:hypothetical protein
MTNEGPTIDPDTETHGYEEWGASPSRAPQGTPNPISQYFLTLKAILTSPTLFFRNLERPTGIAGPLFFGIVTNWIGSALEYLWITGFGRFFETSMSDILRALEKTAEIDTSGQTEALLAMRERFMSWAFGVGSVLIDPFKTCAKILFLSFFVWIAARIFGNITNRTPDQTSLTLDTVETRFSYDAAVAVVGFSMASSLFKGIPLVGAPIAWTFAVILSVIGARETYRVSKARAVVIALFPSLLLWGMLLAIVLALLGGVAMLFLH